MLLPQIIGFQPRAVYLFAQYGVGLRYDARIFLLSFVKYTFERQMC